MKLKLISLVILIMTLSSCTKDDNFPTIVFDETTVEPFTFNGGEEVINFNAPEDWYIFNLENNTRSNDNGWVNIKPMEGRAGNSSITINTTHNTTAETRKSLFVVVMGTEKDTITIEQAPPISVDKELFEFDFNTHSSEFTVYSEIPYITGWGANRDINFSKMTRNSTHSITYSYIIKENFGAPREFIVDICPDEGYTPLCVRILQGADETIIPDGTFDPTFKQFLLENYDSNADGVLMNYEIKPITRLLCSESNIESLKGLEYFPNLEYLACSNNKLKTLDISHNEKLEHVSADYNELTSITFGNNSIINALSVSNNLFTTLDVSSLTSLTFLICSNNPITYLDVTKNTELSALFLDKTYITDIDLSKNPKLTGLRLNNTKLNNLNLESNTNLVELWANDCGLTTINLKNNIKLEKISLSYNNLSSIDLSTLVNLKNILIGDNPLNTIDVSNNIMLESIEVASAGITTIDVSNNKNLIILYISYNNFETIDVSNNPDLKYLIANNNNFSKIDISNNLNMYNFECRNNKQDVEVIWYSNEPRDLFIYDDKVTFIDKNTNMPFTWE